MAGAVRLGLVGAGRWGRVVIRTLAGLPPLRLAAVSSTNPDTAARLPAACVQFTDWRVMIAAGGLDGVIVATPPATHAAIAIAALDAGLAVVVEKPLTLDRAEALAIRAAAERARVPVLVDHTHLFAPAWRRLKELAADLGPVLAVESVAGNHGPYRDDTAVLWDWGAHDVALCLDLLGSHPDTVAARVLERRAVPGGTGETLRLDLGFGRVAATITLGTLMDKTRRIRVVCAGGTLVYDDLAADKLTRDGARQAVDPRLPLTAAMAEFAAAIVKGGYDSRSLDCGLAVVEVLERCTRSLA
ncbi:MAG: Gfo/Idh/MocA family oxidoreductase [Magnetospirillum sp.]|nr:Gfo/Idh/MocA family oxidoreductase [Magnetospirillum sp.]